MEPAVVDAFLDRVESAIDAWLGIAGVNFAYSRGRRDD
jgi:hypothetical protein